MRHHLRLTVLLPALIAACDGDTESQGPAASGSTSMTFDTNLCDGGRYEPFVGLTLAPGLDYFELRQRERSVGEMSLGAAGTECATASDKPTCTTARSTATATAPSWLTAYGFVGDAISRVGITTKGDTVTTISDPSALGAVLAPIDNPKDAAFLLFAVGRSISCEGNNATKTATGYSVKARTGQGCGSRDDIVEHVYAITTEGVVTETSSTVIEKGNPNCTAGRRPDGLVAAAPRDWDDPVGRFFAEVAHLEAASVLSFARLAGELQMLGAPAALIDAAHASREDEVRHARMTSKMAKRFGAEPATPRVTETSMRSELAIALENAVEGCVRETYGALVAHRQAAAASDESIRCMMQVIAEDETKHAGLAWDVAAWLEPRLTVDERVLVDDARRRAVADLRRELETEVESALQDRAGMPDARTALRLLDALDQRFIAC
jgi:hypothetical protein